MQAWALVNEGLQFLTLLPISYQPPCRQMGVTVSLKTKFRIFVGMAAIGMLALSAFWITSERSRILNEKEEKTRNLVEVPYSILEKYQKMEADGKLSRSDAQRVALADISAMRYEGHNYFWVNDSYPRMIMHPIKPELNGKDLSDYKDPNGTALFVEFARTVKANGSGFVSYMWAKPGLDPNHPVAKLSFVKGFQPWGWIVGTGIYIDDLDAARRESATRAAGITLVCLFVLLAGALSVSRSIFHRLADMRERMKDIAEGEGDLTKRIEVTSHDEVGELAQWFNTFIEKLERTIGKVSSSTYRLASASEEIAANSQEQARAAELQLDQTSQVATAMQEMAATVQQVSENAGSAATAAQKAAETARQGGQVVEETLTKMGAIAESVENSAKKIRELGKRSDQIGEIILTIDDIADQTNLLALNAAIEAARAGDQGRGFAVVAEEVRKLAGRTSTATKEIADMIRGIQAETKDAVNAMEAGTQQVETGVASTRKSGASLQEIIQTSEQVGDMIGHIATAVTEQSTATEEVNNSVDQISKITQSAAAGVAQATKAFEELSNLALDLQQLVQQFRVSAEIQGGAPNSHRGAHSGSARRKADDDGVTARLDFSRVKMAHRSWRLKLRGFLDGREDIDVGKLASHASCELGRWIYDRGMASLSENSDFRELEQEHKSMHEAVKTVVELKNAGDTAQAEEALGTVTAKADRVVDLLTRLEAQVSRKSMAAAAR
jgi:methyl-accepting chemotaxis protein